MKHHWLIILIVLILSACSAPEPTTEVLQPVLQYSTPQPNSSTLPGGLALPFPRLGMWWPNTWEQPLDEIARYDWLILGDWDEPNLQSLRARNPDIILLNSTNACEVSFDPDPEAEPWENEVVRSLPAEWFLTQVGTTLTASVDASETTFHVVEVTTRTRDGEVIDLFRPGEAALIEGESVLIERVNTLTHTLTVQRGYVRPASRHSAGSRIAAHITFWPGSWLMNVSALSGRATIDPAIGPETWPEYLARQSAAQLANPLWNGILVDRSDPNESWLIGDSTARSIDPDQSNNLPDSYAAFDQAWNEGLRTYLTLLRSQIGDERLIYLNWGVPYYDLVNGNNFEGFPQVNVEENITEWYNLTFGHSENGSYFDWMAYARQPNLTMIETYEDNGAPDPGGNEDYANPCAEPGFIPNYRAMRFGLVTALMNDGFYSYEMNTNGHGSLCLMWFDEYDAAGTGQGYLGLPLGQAELLSGQNAEEITLTGTRFESQADLEEWSLWSDAEAGYAADMAVDGDYPNSGDASLRISVTQAEGEGWRVSLSQSGIPLEEGALYTLTFSARAESSRPLEIWLQQNRAPWENLLYFGTVMLTPEWQQFTLTGLSGGDDPGAELIFGAGQQMGTLWLDDIHIERQGAALWQRVYDGGLVLLNATGREQVVRLEGTYRHIAGTQDAEVNTGELVNEVIVPPYDGLILLRP